MLDFGYNLSLLEDTDMSLGTILLVVLILMLVGAFPGVTAPLAGWV